VLTEKRLKQLKKSAASGAVRRSLTLSVTCGTDGRYDALNNGELGGIPGEGA
jgi:hypothetical protein